MITTGCNFPKAATAQAAHVVNIDADEIADMAIAVPGVVVSTNDVISIENALDSLFAVQNETNGLLPYAGRPFPPQAISFTYHLYTLIGVADHYLYTVSTMAALSLFGSCS